MDGDGGHHRDGAQVDVAAVVLARLTARQRLMSVWITAGFSYAEIAQHLEITPQQLSVEFVELSQIFRHIPR